MKMRTKLQTFEAGFPLDFRKDEESERPERKKMKSEQPLLIFPSVILLFFSTFIDDVKGS